MKNENIYSKDNLEKIQEMNGLAPDVMKAFWAFDKTSVADGLIPATYKELIAVAVAVTTHCPFCIDTHGNNARARQAPPKPNLLKPQCSPPQRGREDRSRT